MRLLVSSSSLTSQRRILTLKDRRWEKARAYIRLHPLSHDLSDGETWHSSVVCFSLPALVFMLCLRLRLSLLFKSCSAHSTYLSGRQMINHILVSTLFFPQRGLNQCCSINSSSLMSFSISCVNIPTVDGSNTDFARVCGKDEPSVGVLHEISDF